MKRILILIILLSNVSAFSQPGYNVYFGNLHSHTSNSDGLGTPYEAFTFARDSAHLDFLAVTDHVEMLTFYNFISGIATASSFTLDSVFVGFYGYEWTSGSYGHCDVFNTDQMISPSSSSIYPGGWEILSQFLISNHPSFGQFNHPGRYVSFNNWNDFAYVSSSLDSVFPLLEFQNIQQATDYYERALSHGWHLTPVWNQDNHYADWGLKNNGRAGIWAPVLTKSGLISAIMHRRTFATMDFNASIWIESDTNEMGSVNEFVSPFPLRVVINDADSESWSTCEIVTDKGVLFSFIPDSGNIDSTFVISDSVSWVFVRAVQNDGEMIWSAPLFFNIYTAVTTENTGTCYGIDIKIFEEKVSVITSAETSYPVYVKVNDISGRTLKTVSINPGDGFPSCTEFSLNGEKGGIYNINVYNKRTSITKKLMIVKNR